MFKNTSDNLNLKDAETIIGPSIKVKGDFNGQGNVVVEGILEGSLKTSGSLIIGEKAQIKANVDAKDATISGEVKGNVVIKGHLEVTSTAKLLGDIECTTISIEKGAILNGNCQMLSSETKTSEAKEIKNK